MNCFDILAPIYDRMMHPPDREYWCHLLDLPVDGVLLDAAGGTGRASCNLAPYVQRVVVYDSSKRMLQVAKERNMETLLGTLEQIPFADNSIDRIMLVDAFHHLQNQKQAISELLRVLRPSGRIVVEEPDIAKVITKIAAALEKLMFMRSSFYSLDTVVAMFREHGAEAHIECRKGFRGWIIIQPKTV